MIAAAGLLYLIFIAPSRLPNRMDAPEELDDRTREYTAAMRVTEDSPLHGQTVEEANLRNLPGLFLVEVDRGSRVITPVSPDQLLESGDILVFAGVVSTIIDLQRTRGLEPAAKSELLTSLPGGRNRPMVEAVVSASSPLIGQTVKQSNFRSVYDAVVIAVHRNAERLQGKIGDIQLRPGDTLLMQCAPEFMRLHRNSRDFYLASELAGARKPNFERARVSLGILVAMVLAVALGGIHISIAAFVTVAALIGTRCITPSQAREAVDWSVLITIGCSLGIANAISQSGAANFVAAGLVGSVGEFGPDGHPSRHLCTLRGDGRDAPSQCSGRHHVPDRTRCLRTAGSRLRSLHHDRGDRLSLRLRLPDQLPDASDRLRRRRLSLPRFPTRRIASRRDRGSGRVDRDPNALALLGENPQRSRHSSGTAAAIPASKPHRLLDHTSFSFCAFRPRRDVYRLNCCVFSACSLARCANHRQLNRQN